MNSASIEVKEKMVKLRTKIYMIYLNGRQYAFTILLVHAILHLVRDCSMDKELAFLQLVILSFFKILFRKELKTKLELPYCDDSYLKKETKDENEQKSLDS